MKIAIIGTGKLGAPCANEMVKAGHAVVGFDIVKSPIATFQQTDTLEEAVRGRELIFIAVPTPHAKEYGGELPSMHLPPKDFDYSIVKGILTELNQYCTKDQLVVLISTVLPGTTRREFIPLVKNYKFIYNPYLIAMGSVSWDMVNPEMVIIGTETGEYTGDAHTLINFYNTFISTKISLMNMIQDVAEISGHINVDIVTKALAESTQRIVSSAYMKAGMGDAGACHPRDNIALRWLSDNLELGYDLFGAIMNSRELQAKRIAQKLCRLAIEHTLPIFIHGKSYKPGVPYTDGSYSLLIGHYINQLHHAVTYIDPETEIYNPASVKGVILMAHHAPTTYSHSHVIGSESQKFYCTFEHGSIILDMWRTLKPEDVSNSTLIYYGNTRL